MRFVQPEDVFLLGHNTYYKFQWTEDTDRNFETFGHFARKVEKDVSGPWKDVKALCNNIVDFQEKLPKADFPTGFLPREYHTTWHLRCHSFVFASAAATSLQ